MASSIPDLYELTTRERAIRYRQFARQSEIWAGSALTSEFRDAYRHVAEEWVKLADEVDGVVRLENGRRDEALRV